MMPIDISEYLNLVRTGSKVNTVRGAVADASEAIARYMVTDSINSELETIRTGVYGRDIRAAIYSALDKLSKTEGGTAVMIYDDWTLVSDPCLMGIITADWEEET